MPGTQDDLSELKRAIKAYAQRIAERQNLFQLSESQTGDDVLRQLVDNDTNQSSFTCNLFTAAEIRKDSQVGGVFTELVAACIKELLLEKKIKTDDE